ncbi:MAG TPA: sporulation integral membrane protein YlbJ [Clostridia bacterium]|jgi:sporulation integral membrane protein YlbJ|nr:sporulation integral membrane protein YlbJ [Clostridia bacterium]
MLKKKYLKLIFLLGKILLVLLCGIFMVLYPQVMFNSSLRGLDTWWRIVFPALLPFFVISEIFMGLGLVNFLGVLLEPIMRPLFNLPGTSAFVLAVGYTSGAPIGAVLTGKLRKQNLCSKAEASHLMAFTNNASPLFIFGAVAVGMFNNPALGTVIAGAHYLANLCVGLTLGLFRGPRLLNSKGNRSQEKLLVRAIRALYQANIADGRPIGKLLGDAVKNSVQTLLILGGFIIIFSVIIEVLNVIGLLGILKNFFSLVLSNLQLDDSLLHALSCGFIEMTIGTKLASETTANLEQQLLVASLILGWLGLSIHAQAISMVADTDIDVRPYLIGRVLHSIFAVLWLTVLLKFNSSAVTTNATHFSLLEQPWLYSIHSLINLCLTLLFLLATSFALLAIRYLKYTRKILFFTSIYKKINKN